MVMKKSILLVLFLYSVAVSAQTEAPPSDNSPYSRFGLGDFLNQNFATNAAMGNLSASFQDPYNLNVSNPAASCNLISTAYEIGLNAKFSTLKDKVSSVNTRNGGIGYLALGFPLKNQVNEIFDKRKKSDYRYGMDIGLVPFTNVGYNTEVTKINDITGKQTYNYKGTGSTYKLYWGSSMGYKNWSFGLNLGYLVGRIRSERAILFDDLSNNYSTSAAGKIIYRGFLWNLGAQYAYDFKKKNTMTGKIEASGEKIIVGIYGNTPTRFNTTSDLFFVRQNFKYNSGVLDTVFQDRSNGVKGKGTLPAEISVGITYQKSTKLRMGINYTTSTWSKYTNDAQKETLANTYRLGAGLEYTPDPNSYNKYFNRVRYRLGVNLWTDPRVIKTEQLKGQSVSIGFGLPLVMPRQQVSFVNLTLEAGKLGTSFLEQSYFKTTLGFTLNDNSWFYKRRYN
jgi:hypothetical protein